MSWRSSTSACSVAQNASTLPLVHGVSIWVRMCRTCRSARLRWKRLSIVRTIATNGVPLSLKAQDRQGLLRRQRADAEEEAAEVIDQRDEVATPWAACAAEVERTLRSMCQRSLARSRS